MIDLCKKQLVAISFYYRHFKDIEDSGNQLIISQAMGFLNCLRIFQPEMEKLYGKLVEQLADRIIEICLGENNDGRK